MEIKCEGLYQLYKTLSEKDIILSYTGPVSQNLLVDINVTLMNIEGIQKSSKKIFKLFVELAQNIERYSDQREFVEGYREVGVGILVIFETANSYIISAGNLIEESKVEALKTQCEFISSLSSEEIKTYYHKELHAEHANSKGAGIGIIDIARRTGNDFTFEFNEAAQDYSFFIINVTILKEKES